MVILRYSDKVFELSYKIPHSILGSGHCLITGGYVFKEKNDSRVGNKSGKFYGVRNLLHCNHIPYCCIRNNFSDYKK